MVGVGTHDQLLAKLPRLPGDLCKPKFQKGAGEMSAKSKTSLTARQRSETLRRVMQWVRPYDLSP